MRSSDNESVLKAIGNTPLIPLAFRSKGRVFAKLEYLNPGGSLKDRSALFMIEEAERLGLLKKGGTIIEASSGNQGIALAMIGAVKGYKVIITASKKVSIEKRQTMQAYGAKVVMCEPTRFVEDPRSNHSKAVELCKRIKGAFMPNQYFNLANPEAHFRMLGPEIWKQTAGKITHFLGAAGTTGTVSGVGKFLKKKNKALKVIAADAATSFFMTNGHPKPYKLEGIGVDFETPCLDMTAVDEFVGVTDRQALGMLPVMARKHGLLLGPSSGAVAFAVATYARQLRKGDLLVCTFADSGRAYLSKGYFEV
jgi:cystathionine beta-synthase